MVESKRPAPPSRGVVDGIRIVDFSQFAAGPWCTSFLGDLGADVIKIERPGRGDPSRAFDTLFGPGNCSYFAGMNRNKRSIALDLSSDAGKGVARKLLSTADIVIENFRPGVMDKLGLGYDMLHREFPRLIYCAISAYGESGPYVRKPGMDGVVQAMGGVMGHTGEPGGTPTRIGVPIADFTAAFLSLSAISLALYDREHTGQGQKVSIALLDGQLALFANHMPGFAVTGKPDQPAGTAHPQIEPSRVYRTQNGHMVVTCFTQEFWQRFARTIELPELIADERFRDNPARVKNRTVLTELVEAKLVKRPTTEWIDILERNDVPCTQVNMLRDLATNPQVLLNKMIVDAPHPTAGTVKVIGNPLKFSNAEARIRSGAPELGAQSIEILKECGYADAEVQALVDGGVVALPAQTSE